MSEIKQKYKPCCGRRCLLGICQTRAEGGCYCLCRLKDYEDECLSISEGRSYRSNGAVVYLPNRKPIPLTGVDKDKVEKNLQQIREKIKTYEIKE